jgi:hypothetical protein
VKNNETPVGKTGAENNAHPPSYPKDVQFGHAFGLLSAAVPVTGRRRDAFLSRASRVANRDEPTNPALVISRIHELIAQHGFDAAAQQLVAMENKAPEETEGLLVDPTPTDMPYEEDCMIVTDEQMNAARKNAAAIQKAYGVNEMLTRMRTNSGQVAPAAEIAAMLRNEVRTLGAALKERDGVLKNEVVSATGPDGKKLYSNETARSAALADLQAKDGEYTTLAASLADKQAELATAEAKLSALATESGLIKAEFNFVAAILNSLGAA